MEPDQFNLVFNAVCLFISVAGAIVAGMFYFRTLKDDREEKEKEKKRELSANRDGDDLIDPTDSKL
nr:MAG TPA: Sporulation protein YhaL [Caudoviricetes sp.]